MNLFKTLLIVLMLVAGTFGYSQSTSSYEVVYAADKDGTVISGSRAQLIEYVSNGNPVRVGWDLRMQMNDAVYTMTHWVDAGFITVLQGHVFAQVKSIYGQGPLMPAEGQDPAVFLSNAEPNGWVAIIGTTGVLRQKFKRDEAMIAMLSETMNEKEIDEMLKSQEVEKVSTKWAVMMK